jgi:L-threonylcarbamoyladenylate synthase
MSALEILSVDKEKDIERAISLIKDGQLVAVPTETVYGLAADAKNPEAVKKIFIAKNRPNQHPLILHIDSIEKLHEWAEDIPDSVSILANHFWPGPLTLLLKKKSEVSDIITGGLETIAVRIPDNEVLRKIMSVLDTGLAAPSANPHTKLSPTSAAHVINTMSGKIAAVLDGGSCSVGIESTILNLTTEIPTILRQGPITKKMIEKVLGFPIHAPENHLENVSGNMLKHYQPYTKSILMNTEELTRYTKSLQNKLVGIMHYSDINFSKENVVDIKVPLEKNAYSQTMYDTLHKLDLLNLDEIIIESPPNLEEWSDVLDRMKKATHYL